MSTKTSEKILDALTLLLEGYSELQRSAQKELGGGKDLDEDEDDDDDEDEEEEEVSPEVEAAVVAEIKTTLETVLESEDYSPEAFALVISSLTNALEEIDPDVFESEVLPADEEE